MHVCAYDEAVGVPTEAAATLALRTQQIVAFETGLTETVDPLGGSHAVEELTAELESEIAALMAEIELARRRAGVHRVGLVPGRARRSRLPSGAGSGVGGEARDRRQPLRDPVGPDRGVPQRPGRRAAPAREPRGRARTPIARTRSSGASTWSRRAARSGENVVPACVEAVKAYATVGEIVGRLRGVFGELAAVESVLSVLRAAPGS